MEQARGILQQTRIEPAFIPDRLPKGAIPHFLVEIGPDDLSFSPPATLSFPNTYDLDPGEKVTVFHFKYGIHNFTDLGETEVGENGEIVFAAVLEESGFLGIVPSDPKFDLAQIYLQGRVVDSTGNGLPGIFVNALAGFTVAETDENGEYTIPMPELRLFLLRTFATVPTSLGISGDENPFLVFQSELAELNPSGITLMPDIVVDTFFLGGNIRFINADGEKIPRTGLGYDKGEVTAIDDATAQGVSIFIYRQVSNNSGDTEWDTIPYSRSQATQAPTELGFDASFALPIVGSLCNTEEQEDSTLSAPKPGDLVKIVAFSRNTGFYGEIDVQIPNLGSGSSGTTNIDVVTSVDLRPAQVTLDISREFFIDAIRRRANVPKNGVVLASDDFVEVRTSWRTPTVVPLDRDELRLQGRLMIDSIEFQEDIFFQIHGGEHTRIVEIREGLFPQRLDVLQKNTDIGTESFTLSANGSFDSNSLIPLQVKTSTYGLLVPEQEISDDLHQAVTFHVLDVDIEQFEGEMFRVEGRSLPGSQIQIGSTILTADSEGFFSTLIDTISEDGLLISVNGSQPIIVGASFTPQIESISPIQGVQGAVMTINGRFFSTAPDQNNVKFNGAPATVVSATEGQLQVIVPEEATSGDVTVTVAGKTSNGIFFDFISEGIRNGSFEDATFRGFSTTGISRIIKKQRNIEPTDRTFMAFLCTVEDPIDGQASLTTNRFFIPEGFGQLAFDFNFLGTALFEEVQEYIDFSILDGETEVFLENVIPNNIPKLTFSEISGYNLGTGFQTAFIDLSTFAGSGTPVQLRFTLRGRGALPTRIPGLRPDDDNPLDITKAQGTALLLDNIRLTPSIQLLQPLHLTSLLISDPVNGNATINVASGTVTPDGQVFAWNIHSGQQFFSDAGNDGSFSITLPVIAGIFRTSYIVSYATPKTTTDNSSDRVFSPFAKFSISNMNM